MPSHSHNRLQYRVGEFALVVTNDQEELVIRIVEIIAWGELVQFSPVSRLHAYSCNPIVVPSSDHVIVLTNNIKRKLILYLDPENIEDPQKYVVMDYLCSEIPYTARIFLFRSFQKNMT